ncbi:hypothetical protein SHIRM173S_00490 [Streptomyces hirsutus]
MSAGGRPDSGWRRIPFSYLGYRGGDTRPVETARPSLSPVARGNRPPARGPRGAPGHSLDHVGKAARHRLHQRFPFRPGRRTAFPPPGPAGATSPASAPPAKQVQADSSEFKRIRSTSGGFTMSKRVLIGSFVGALVVGGAAAGFATAHGRARHEYAPPQGALRPQPREQARQTPDCAAAAGLRSCCGPRLPGRRRAGSSPVHRRAQPAVCSPDAAAGPGRSAPDRRLPPPSAGSCCRCDRTGRHGTSAPAPAPDCRCVVRHTPS